VFAAELTINRPLLSVTADPAAPASEAIVCIVPFASSVAVLAIVTVVLAGSDPRDCLLIQCDLRSRER
jgi:Asp-tRNA(Asn)/Glu-tRNA(Gln) amidotransferase A subunit family amidase